MLLFRRGAVWSTHTRSMNRGEIATKAMISIACVSVLSPTPYKYNHALCHEYKIIFKVYRVRYKSSSILSINYVRLHGHFDYYLRFLYQTSTMPVHLLQRLWGYVCVISTPLRTFQTPRIKKRSEMYDLNRDLIYSPVNI